MHNPAQITRPRSRLDAHESPRSKGQPVVVMATLGAEQVDANGAPCEPAVSDARARVGSVHI